MSKPDGIFKWTKNVNCYASLCFVPLFLHTWLSDLQEVGSVFFLQQQVSKVLWLRSLQTKLQWAAPTNMVGASSRPSLADFPEGKRVNVNPQN